MSAKNSPTDDDNSSTTISNELTETLSIANDDDVRSIQPSQCHVRIYPVRVENVCMLPNLTIKHPNRTDGNDPFTDEQRIIDDKHVKVSRLDRSTVPRLTTDLSLLRMKAYAQQKATGTVLVSRSSQRTLNQKPPDKQQQQQQLLSRQNTVRINRIPTTDNLRQIPHQTQIPPKIKENVIHISIKRQTTT